LSCHPSSITSRNIAAIPIGIVLALIAVALGALTSGTAFASSVASYEAEASESKPTGATVVSDATSSGGEYVRYTSQGTATKQGVVVPEGGATGITVLAKAKPSGSLWPELEVFVNGEKVGTSGSRVNSTSYAEYSFQGTIPAGTHTVGMRADEGMKTKSVDNSAELHVDVVRLTAPDPDSDPTVPLHQAKSADAFVDSIGVATHIKDLKTVYGSDYPNIKAALDELGVKHVRDAAVKLSNYKVYSRWRDLNHTLGIHFNLTVNENLFPTPPAAAQINQIVSQSGGAVESFEGPNEFNNDHKYVGWGQDLRQYQCTVYNNLSASNNAQIPMLAAAIGKQGGEYPPLSQIPELGDCSDINNIHSFPGGNQPSGANPNDPLNYSVLFDRDMPMANHMGVVGRDVYVTETGYSTADNYIHEVSEEAHKRYGPRLSFEYFNAKDSATEPDANIVRGYHYQLRDPFQGTTPQSHFGLIDVDNRKKPVFRALENTIDILEDPGASFTAGSLRYELSGASADVHSTLLQKRNKVFYLCMWQEVRSYDKVHDVIINEPAENVTITFGQAQNVKVFAVGNIASSGPADDAESHPSRTLSSVSSVTEPIGDQVKIIEVTKP
jgi:hypothetical protein